MEVAIMLNVDTEKYKMDTLMQELSAMNTKILLFSCHLRAPYSHLTDHFYDLDVKKGKLDNFIHFLYEEMDYVHNQFSQREIFEIYVSFVRPTLQYKKIYDIYFKPEKLNPFGHWEKVNFAQILLENCDRSDFLHLLISYNRHLPIFLYPDSTEEHEHVTNKMITPESELYETCAKYFTISAGFELGLNISCVEYSFLNKENVGLKLNDFRDVDNSLSEIF